MDTYTNEQIQLAGDKWVQSSGNKWDEQYYAPEQPNNLYTENQILKQQLYEKNVSLNRFINTNQNRMSTSIRGRGYQRSPSPRGRGYQRYPSPRGRGYQRSPPRNRWNANSQQRVQKQNYRVNNSEFKIQINEYKKNMCKLCLHIHNPEWSHNHTTNPCWFIRNKVCCENMINGVQCKKYHHPYSLECLYNQSKSNEDELL